MFERFSLPDLAAVARRTVLGSLIVGVVGLVVLIAINQLWAALGLCVGIGIGLSNFRLAQRSVVRVSKRMAANKRRPLALNTFGRMASVTVLALGLIFVKPALAFGLLGGLAVFQALLLANVTRSMLKMGVDAGMGSFGLDVLDVDSAEVEGAADHRLPVEVPDDGDDR